MPSLLETSTQRSFLKHLLAWYKKEGRHDMPWRNTGDPYAIFVSEFMLQQTTVATVRPYFDRFLGRFPTLKALSQSSLDDVLALWSGLGYYARARNLWHAAKDIQEEFGGKIPSDPVVLQKLPGIGLYTAGAIAALAFNRPSVVLDGNIIRVLMRLLALDDDPKLKAVQVVLRKVSVDLMKVPFQSNGAGKASGPRDIVLALMDLGATLCAPKNPACLICPVASFCLAKSYGRQEEIPWREERADRPTIRQLCGLIPSKGKWLFGQRPAEGLFGGLWEFPSIEVPSGIEPVPFLEETLKKELGIQIQVRQALPPFEHQLTHRIILVRGFLCDIKRKSRPPKLSKKSDAYDRFKWVAESNISKFGISAVTRRLLHEPALVGLFSDRQENNK